MSSANPLEDLCSVWVNVLKKSETHKENAFGKTALECWRFFGEAHDFMYGKGASGLGFDALSEINTDFKMTLNKVAELVQIFGPTLYFKNPYRQVNTRIPSVPDGAYMAMGSPEMAFAAQQQAGFAAEAKKATASLLQDYLNYTPHELGLKWQSRKAIDEALIKGRGLLWHEMTNPPESDVLMPYSYFVSVDDLLIDPDAESLEDAKWVARIRCMPTYEVEERFQLEKGNLKKHGKLESVMQQADVESAKHGIHYRRMGETHDLCVFYEVWSKCGLGQNLKLGGTDAIHSEVRKLGDELDKYGKHVYLAICPGCPYLLNLPPEIMDLPEDVPGVSEQIAERLKWPIPFHLDVGGNGWPFTELDFHPIPRSSWPQAHMKSGLGELKFLNWAFSFLAGRMRHTSRLFFACNEAMDEEQMDAIENGGDLTVIKFKGLINKNINELVQFLQAPEINSDMWNVIAQVMALFDKRVGLTELMYGLSGKQNRSAAEAQIKSEQVNIRPDDMAELVEEWQSRIARKEGIMARLFVGPESVADMYGEPYDPMGMQIGPMTRMWQQFVYRPINPMDPTSLPRIFREFDFRIEAGSIRKPNRDRDQANMDQAMQTVFPSVYQHGTMTGDFSVANTLLAEWAKTRDIPKELVMLTPMPPPPPMDPSMDPSMQQQDPNAMQDPSMMGGDPMMQQQPAIPFPGVA